MASLLADEHIWPSICNFLSQLGHELHAVRQFCTDKAGDSLSDDVVLQIAVEHGFAVVTKNADDFIALHKAKPWHTGIIVCRYDNKEHPQTIARRIDDEIKAVGDLRGKLLRVSTESAARLRRRGANRGKKKK